MKENKYRDQVGQVRCRREISQYDVAPLGEQAVQDWHT